MFGCNSSRFVSPRRSISLAVACAMALGNAPLAMAAPSTDINSYVLFATQELSVKGANGGNGGNILGGNIGVNEVGNASDPDYELKTGAGDEIYMSAGTHAVANGVSIGDGSIIGDLFANKVNPSFDPAIVTGTGPTAYTLTQFGATKALIDPANITALFPSFTVDPNASDVNVPTNGKIVLAPNQDYRDVRINDNGLLELSAGIYTFRNLDGGSGAKITTKDGTEVRIKRTMTFNDDSVISGSTLAKFYVEADGINKITKSVSFGYHTQFYGQILAPNSRLNLGDNTDFFGRVWARWIDSDARFNITYKAPESVKGRFFDDTFCDAKEDPNDPALAGITVYLDCNLSGTFDQGERTTVTGQDGKFEFANVSPATCAVRPIVSAPRQCSFPSPNCSYTINIGTNGQVHDGNIFGLSNPQSPNCSTEEPGKESVSGNIVRTPTCQTTANIPVKDAQVYLDCNKNGALDLGERSTFTDASGNFSFADAPVGNCAIRVSTLAGLKCLLTGDCSHNVVIGQIDGVKHGPFNFAFGPLTDETCENPGSCEAETHVQSSMGIDARGYRLFGLSKRSINLAKKLGKKSGKPVSAKKARKIFQLANDNYLTLWSLAFNAFPTTTFKCTGNATLACQQRFTAERQAMILHYADTLIAELKKTLGKKGQKTADGKKIVKNALKQRAEILGITQTFPTSYFVCDK